jgi:mannose-6-phosphate isomerase-like protein (cupin superfamily)
MQRSAVPRCAILSVGKHGRHWAVKRREFITLLGGAVDRQKREPRGRAVNRRGDIHETANRRGRIGGSLGSSYATAQEMRRVVTGLDDRNHSVVLFDSKMPLKQVAPGIIATNFWITDTYPPSLLKDDPSGRTIGTAPPDNGTKFRVVEFLPLDAATEAKMPPEMLQKGITNAPARGIPVKHPLMHRTRSLDYAIILSGEIDMMLDDGDVHLKPGDVIVQQATNHGIAARSRVVFSLC